MAETIRLIFHLRQSFLKKHNGKDSCERPTLVSDYDSLKKRLLPKRNIQSSDAINQLKKNIDNWSKISILQKVLNKKGSNFLLASFQVEQLNVF